MTRLLIPGLAFLAISAGSLAQDGPGDEWLNTVKDELAGHEEDIETADNTLSAYRSLKATRKALSSIQSSANDCILKRSQSASSLQGKRAALGETATGDGAGVRKLRDELDQEISRNEQLRIGCEQVAQAADDLLDRIEQRKNAELKARLLARGVTALHIADDALKEPQAWSRLVAGFLDEGSGWENLSGAEKITIFSVIAIALASGFVLRKRIKTRKKPGDNALLLISALPWILAFGLGCLLFLWFLPEWPPAVVTRVALGATGWLFLSLVLHAWINGRQKAGLSKKDAVRLLFWMRILLALLVVGTLTITAEAVLRLPDSNYFLLRSAIAWLALIGTIWSAILLGHIPGLAGTRGLRVIMVLVMLAVAVAESLGYRNLSLYLLAVFVGTAAGYIFATALSRFATFIYDGMDEGQYAWQRSLRRLMQLKAKEVVPGLVWLRLATTLSVWTGFIVWTLWVWGQSDRWIAEISRYFTSGFEIGSLHIQPLKLLGAIAVLAIGISISGWFKQSIVTDLVRRSRLDHGGREAIVTLSGYLGVFLSLLIALGMAGVSYTHLAIIAGALSVGIGFGLQNVVNNFVSGLILLFERPIRTGDWIVVGDTQGYVRKISIRSTRIETFDRADVIVPNSELIAQKVSNWMLHDSWGRITIPVGVAYGSDVEKVVDVLVGVAREHEGVLLDQPGVPPPKALFRRFGDSALEFELRCFIRQIDRAFDITHDLNMAIDRKFREAGITVPFPQRDVHIKHSPGENSTD